MGGVWEKGEGQQEKEGKKGETRLLLKVDMFGNDRTIPLAASGK